MNDTENNQPFEQRKSQNLGFRDYVKDTLFWTALPLIGGALTFLGGRVSRKFFDNKLWPLDGSPTLIYSMYEKGAFLLFDKATGQKAVIKETDRLIHATYWLPKEKRLDATRDIWNTLKGMELAFIPTIFHFWKRGEKQRLDLEPSYGRLKQLEGMNPTNAELAEDNTSLKQQLSAMESSGPASTIASAQTQHHGTVQGTSPQKAMG